MGKNMQISKLLMPKFIIENNCNIQSVFDLLQHYDENIQNQTDVMTNGNYVSVQQLNYHASCDGDGDGDGEGGCCLAVASFVEVESFGWLLAATLLSSSLFLVLMLLPYL
jgi:hypothetical protein